MGQHYTQVTTVASLLLLLLMLVNAQKFDNRSKILKISDARCVKGKHGAVLTKVNVQNYTSGWKCLSFASCWPGNPESPRTDGSRQHSYKYHLLLKCSIVYTYSYTCTPMQSSKYLFSQKILEVMELYFIAINSFFLFCAKNTDSSQPCSFI